MVIQRDQPIKVFGTANVGETITVKFDGSTGTQVTAPNGQ